MNYLYHDTREFVDTADKYAALPAGKYKAMITKVEEKMSNSSGIPYVSLTIEILDGQYKGRKVWDMLSVNSSNPQAIAIAKRKLNDIAMAVGVMVIQGEDCFKYKELGIELIVDKKDETKNQIKKYIAKKDVPDVDTSYMAAKKAYVAEPVSSDVPF